MLDQFGVVHREQGFDWVRASRSDGGTGCCDGVEYGRRPVGYLGARFPDAEPDLAVRLVPQAVDSPDDGQSSQVRCHQRTGR